MPVKTVTIPELGDVRIIKRRQSRAVRITINSDGVVRVSVPTWVPYKAGAAFALQKKSWILKQLSNRKQALSHNQQIGKDHVLSFQPDHSIISCRVSTNDTMVVVRYPATLTIDHIDVQNAALRGSKRALQRQAEDYLPRRLHEVSKIMELDYRSVSVRQLSARWGSCSSQKDITLNYFLMLLPNELIDYVIVHELTHTMHMNHSPDFWQNVRLYIPNLKETRKRLRSHQPSVFAAIA